MRPAREKVRSAGQTFFVSTQTMDRQPFFRHERWAVLLQEVLQHYRGESYRLHAYVVMPDHLHLIISPEETLERAIQNMKGGFSFRAKRDFQWRHAIWQVGFSDHRIRDKEDWDHHISYMRSNPTSANLGEDYRYLAFDLDPIPQRLKPISLIRSDGGAEAPPLRKPFVKQQQPAPDTPLQKRPSQQQPPAPMSRMEN